MPTTLIPRHRLRRFEPLVLAVLLCVLWLAATERGRADRCPQDASATRAASAGADAGDRRTNAAPARTPDTAPPASANARRDGTQSTGLDVEVKIWNVHVEFPWLRVLPVTPARRVVVRLFDTTP